MNIKYIKIIYINKDRIMFRRINIHQYIIIYIFYKNISLTQWKIHRHCDPQILDQRNLKKTSI